jgi:sulfur relay protein TusB/DsrH
VIAVKKGSTSEQFIRGKIAEGIAIYALEPDLHARSLTASDVIENVKIVSYGDFVNLVAEKYEKTVSGI